jgi:hypothetical protein
MFAADLDAAPAVSEGKEQEQEQEHQLSLGRPGQAEGLTAAAGTASMLPTEDAAADSSSSSSGQLEASAAAQYASRAAARKKRSVLLQQRAAKLVGFDVWLDDHAEQAAAFVAVAEKLGLQAEPLLLHIFKSRATHLLTCTCALRGNGTWGTQLPPCRRAACARGILVWLDLFRGPQVLAGCRAATVWPDSLLTPAACWLLSCCAAVPTGEQGEQGEQAASGGDGGAAAAVRLQAEAALQAALAMLTSLGVHSSAQPRMLSACPQLMVRQPGEDAVAKLQALFGGRAALAAAAARNPGILLLRPGWVQRRLQLLALHLHSDAEVAAAAVTRAPPLLAVQDKVLNENARWGGRLAGRAGMSDAAIAALLLIIWYCKEGTARRVLQ